MKFSTQGLGHALILATNSTSISRMGGPHTESCLPASPLSTPHVAPVAVFVLNRTCQNVSISYAKTGPGWSGRAGWEHTAIPGSYIFLLLRPPQIKGDEHILWSHWVLSNFLISSCCFVCSLQSLLWWGLFPSKLWETNVSVFSGEPLIPWIYAKSEYILICIILYLFIIVYWWGCIIYDTDACLCITWCFIYKLISSYLYMHIHAFSYMTVLILYVCINMYSYFCPWNYNTVCSSKKLVCMALSDISLPGVRLSLGHIQGHWNFLWLTSRWDSLFHYWSETGGKDPLVCLQGIPEKMGIQQPWTHSLHCEWPSECQDTHRARHSCFPGTVCHEFCSMPAGGGRQEFAGLGWAELTAPQDGLWIPTFEVWFLIAK